ncbi:hypothetical protein [uncultured Methanobrevibacter sp.]|uniref:hypothetical protein n=1 Tax=uncultured Methanobrevibacter sp. TaxID=253161 RepID=UPI0025F07C43|nr:hypothetical protein [uncultured Methanobrevibacter sp.]
MKFRGYLYVAMIFLVCILCISGVNAADDAGDIIGANDNQDFILEHGLDADALSVDNDDNSNELVDSLDVISGSFTDSDKNINGKGSFTDLNKDINGNNNEEISLNHDYVFNRDKDSSFIHGIYINRNVSINGNGFTIDGLHKARLFDIGKDANVTLENINFINGYAYGNGADANGGAVNAPYNDTCVVRNSTFTGNIADNNGGATQYGTIINCTYRDKYSKSGGAMVPYYMINSMFMDSKDGSFSDLNNDINGNDDDEITLLKQYVFNIDKDSSFIHGVPINRNVIINGVGITIDGANMARLFDIGPNACVKFLNLNFINGNASGKDTYGHGGAIYAPYKGTCIMEKCTFTNNTAEFNGGAVFGGNAIGCTFTGNTAQVYGGAVLGGNADGCTFTGNSATFGGAMSDSDASNSIFNNNTAGTDGGALFKSDAEKCDFNFNSAGRDGGVMYYGTADKCNFNRNSAQRDAGGIVLWYCKQLYFQP